MQQGRETVTGSWARQPTGDAAEAFKSILEGTTHRQFSLAAQQSEWDSPRVDWPAGPAASALDD